MVSQKFVIWFMIVHASGEYLWKTIVILSVHCVYWTTEDKLEGIKGVIVISRKSKYRLKETYHVFVPFGGKNNQH